MNRILLLILAPCMFINALFAQDTTAVQENKVNNPDSVYRKLYPKPVLETYTGTPILKKVSSPAKSPISVSSSNLPLSEEPDKTLSVGEIEINSGMTPTGGKTYEIPLKLPAGMHGFKPEISLSYNSQRRNSFLGLGWDIEGCSKITRGSQCLYYDASVRGVSNDTDDAFYLDGIRLIKLSSEDSCIWYQTETGNIKAKLNIVGTGSLDSDYKYFEVFYPNGNTGLFKILYSSSYYLYELNDIWGNTIKYSYSGIGFVTEIFYNDNYIEFVYNERPDPSIEYIGGKENNYSYLLSKIKIGLGNTDDMNFQTLRTYTLSYTINCGSSLLSSISLSEGENSYNPLTFYYGTGNEPQNMEYGI